MNFTYKLVQKAKEKQGFNSDYAVGKLVGISSQMIYRWKNDKAEANAENTLKLMAAAGVTVDAALSMMTEHPTTAGGALSKSSRMMYIM